jgi:hypothetical protein
MNIRITDPHDEERIRKFAKTKRLPITKAVGEAVRLADEVLFMQGKVASLQFFIKCLREEYAKKNPLIR